LQRNPVSCPGTRDLRNRVSLDNLGHQPTTVIETRFLVGRSQSVPKARSSNLKRLETGFLSQGRWGYRDFAEKPGFLSLGFLAPRVGNQNRDLRNRVSLDNLGHQPTTVIETRFLVGRSQWVPKARSSHLKRLETGFLSQGRWGSKG
jgi:hypothetical protein